MLCTDRNRLVYVGNWMLCWLQCVGALSYKHERTCTHSSAIARTLRWSPLRPVHRSLFAAQHILFHYPVIETFTASQTPTISDSTYYDWPVIYAYVYKLLFEKKRLIINKSIFIVIIIKLYRIDDVYLSTATLAVKHVRNDKFNQRIRQLL